MVGSHWQQLVQYKHLEQKSDQTVKEMLEEAEIADCVEYLFEGHCNLEQ